MRDAIAALASDKDFHGDFIKNLFKRSSQKLDLPARSIPVRIDPTPTSTTVEIDGIYVGNSPVSRELHVGDAYRLRLAKPGFKPWEAVIRPEPGLTVSPELESLARSTNYIATP